jgi:hypothetical protein
VNNNVIVGNEDMVKAHEQGTVVYLQDGESGHQIVLKIVVQILNFRKNIVSMGRMLKNGTKISSEGTNLVPLNPNNNNSIKLVIDTKGLNYLKVIPAKNHNL